MDDPFVVVLIAVAILVAVGVEYAKYKKDTGRIRFYLLGRGATDISISKYWFGGSEYHNVYDVTYNDAKGRRRQNRCIIRSSIFIDGLIYWEHDLSS